MSKSNKPSIAAKLAESKSTILTLCIIAVVIVIVLFIAFFSWAYFQGGTYKVGDAELELKPFGGFAYTENGKTTELAYRPANGNILANEGMLEVVDGDKVKALMTHKANASEGLEITIVPADFLEKDYEIVDCDGIYEIRDGDAIKQLVIKLGFEVVTPAEETFTITNNNKIYEIKDGETYKRLVYYRDGTYVSSGVSDYEVTFANGLYEMKKNGEIARVLVCEEDSCYLMDGKKGKIVLTDSVYTLVGTDAEGKDYVMATATLNGDNYEYKSEE